MGWIMGLGGRGLGDWCYQIKDLNSLGCNDSLKVHSMLTKKQVLSVVKNMPENFDTAQLFDRILLVNKVEEGRQQLKEGKGVPTAEAKKKLKKWLK